MLEDFKLNIQKTVVKLEPMIEDVTEKYKAKSAKPIHIATQLKVTTVGKSEKTETAKVQYLTTSDFRKKIMDYEAHPDEWVFAGSRPAVIDFYTTWCGPCKMMAPVVESLAEKYAGKIDFYKVDIDQESELASVFGISSIPTFLFIPMKGKPSVQMGAMQKEDFEELIGKIKTK